ncbi:hypothetical protein [Streptomyces axinellae]|uniref:Uncharacterized protein n=1 Tax=Streptomyces axinellae TaxID=552788 RepID=A0ABP6D1K2_9ACTN
MMRPAARAALFLAGLLLVLVPGLAQAVVSAVVWSVQSPVMVGAGLAVTLVRLVFAPAPVRGWSR